MIAAGPLGGLTTVKALQAVMYRDMKGWGGAYRLLNASGAIGSQGLSVRQTDVTPHCWLCQSSAHAEPSHDRLSSFCRP